MDIMSDTDEKILKALGDLQADVKGLKGDVAGIKSDVGTLKADVDSLKTDVAILRGVAKKLLNLDNRRSTSKSKPSTPTSNEPTLRSWDTWLIRRRFPGATKKRLRSGFHALKST
jgi:hypothetical protein